MKNLLIAGFLSLVALGMSVGDAEAARLGGGKSFGMQRQAVTPRPAAPTQAAPAPSAPAGAAAAAPKRNWMGPIAGLAAGLGIAALLSHFGLGEGMANILMIALLAMAAVFVVKLLMRRAAPARPSDPLQYAGGARPELARDEPSVVPFPGARAAVNADSAARIPAGFDSEGFLRVAKLNFIRLQAANDSGDLADIREFVSPELYAEIKMQLDERGQAAQQTDVVTLNAELLEVVSEDARHIASVQFSGMLRETAGAPATPFTEVWHLAKPVAGDQGWIIAGIQQIA